LDRGREKSQRQAIEFTRGGFSREFLLGGITTFLPENLGRKIRGEEKHAGGEEKFSAFA